MVISYPPTCYHFVLASGKKVSGPRQSVFSLASSSDPQLFSSVLVSSSAGVKYFQSLTQYQHVNCTTYSAFLIKFLGKPSNFLNCFFVFHSTFIFRHLLIAFALRLFSFKYFIFPRGGLSRGAFRVKKLKKYFFYYLCFRSFFVNAHASIFLSDDEKSNSIFRGRSFISPNGCSIPSELLSKFIYKKYTHKSLPSKVIIGLLGRLDPHHKGIDILFEYSYRFNKSSVPLNNLGLHFMGPYTAAFHKLLRTYPTLDISVNTPTSSLEAKSSFISGLDIFICLSRFEGQPQAALEALALGVPLIVSMGSNMSRCVLSHDLGWVVTSYAEFENALIQFHSLSFIQRRALSSRCIKYISSNCNWKNIAHSFQLSLLDHSTLYSSITPP